MAFYMGMVMEEDQSFEGLIEHLQDDFQSGETLSELISNFYGWSQRAQETKDTFTDTLQVFARKIIACKPSFRLETIVHLKAQYVHKLWDPFYVAMAHSALQSPLQGETFTRFQGHLATMFGGHMRQNRSSATSSGNDTVVVWKTSCPKTLDINSIRLISRSHKFFACKTITNN